MAETDSAAAAAALLAGLVALWAPPGAPAAVAAAPVLQTRTGGDPQYQALETLRRASAIPVRARFAQGVARSLVFDLPADSTDPVAAARAFVARYADLFLQGPARSGGGPDRTGRFALPLRGVTRIGGDQVVGFFQTVDGIPVFGASLTLTFRARPGARPRLSMAAGALLPRRPVDTRPALLPETAEATALAAVGGGLPARLRGETRLMIHDPLLAGGAPDPRLAWSVPVDAGEAWQVLVDAHSGQVLKRFEHGRKGYELYLQDAHGGNIMDTQCFNPSNLDEYIGDEDGIVTRYLGNVDAVQLWWHLKTTYQSFLGIFGRDSYDGDGIEIEAYINADLGGKAGRYVASCGFEFEPGEISLDVTAHEFAHAVTWLSSQLVYAGLPGALDESYADVMAAVVDGQDWLIAEDRTGGGGAIRSLADPRHGTCGRPPDTAPCNQPDRYSELCVSEAQCPGFTADNQGVHMNSGIPSKAHYLMAEGGTHGGVTVAGMGRLKMGHLAYAAMQSLPQVADFLDARGVEEAYAQAWAAQGTFGFTAQDACTVRNAWAAVEVGFRDMDCDGVDDATDSDGDGHPDLQDNCPDTPNVIQWDWDMDGIGDSCDPDEDGDSCPDELDNCPGTLIPCTGVHLGSPDTDGDGLGDACDGDDDGDGVPDGEDNCPWHANRDQFDGNRDGAGDACDPDVDGDGFYQESDNCTFVANPDQADADGDGIGDACDDCPGTADSLAAYTRGYPELGIDPEPFQPDSDGDGTPDACDATAFGTLAVALDGAAYNPARPLRPDGAPRAMALEGPAGAPLALPLELCPGDRGRLADSERIQLLAAGLPASMDLWITDELGTRVALLSEAAGEDRGLRFRPDCRRRYRLATIMDGGLRAKRQFTLTLEAVDAGSERPWPVPASGYPAPPAIPDQDADGLSDELDNCPARANPTQADGDGDGFGDVCDRCPGDDAVRCALPFGDGFESPAPA